MNDWSSLSGDPMATQTEDEWSADMLKRLEAATTTQQLRWIQEMTTDEVDMVIAAYRRQEPAS